MKINQKTGPRCHARFVVPWPEYTDHDGETAQLMRTVDQDWCWQFPGWQWVADQINAEYGNNRTAEACRKKWDVESRKEVARCNPSRHNVNVDASADEKTLTKKSNV